MLVALVIGVLGGAVAGFVAAIATLAARRWRIGRLVARGEPAIKDALLPRPFVPFAAIVGGVLAAGLATQLAPVTAGAIGAATPGVLLAALAIGSAISRS
jgi:hypothetical protein